jgi:gas vesicle protein
MDTGKVVLSVLAGIAAGALLGVLFAPDKGSVTRKNIAKKGTDAMDEVKDKYDEILKAFTDKLEQAKEEVSNLFDSEEIKSEIAKVGSKAVSG